MFFHPARINAVDGIKKSGLPIASLDDVVEFRREIVNEIPVDIHYLGLENIISNTGEYVETGEKESISSAFVFKKEMYYSLNCAHTSIKFFTPTSMVFVLPSSTSCKLKSAIPIFCSHFLVDL